MCSMIACFARNSFVAHRDFGLYNMTVPLRQNLPRGNSWELVVLPVKLHSLFVIACTVVVRFSNFSFFGAARNAYGISLNIIFSHVSNKQVLGICFIEDGNSDELWRDNK